MKLPIPAVRGKWSSRKFWAMMFWEAAFLAVFLCDKMSESTFESLTFLLLGGYLLSNVADKRRSKEDTT